jgi:hypothetical protein
MSFQILFVVWQKTDPASGKGASKSLINITYSLISEEKYEIAVRLIEFLLGVRSNKMDDGTRRTHIINCANAKKLMGDSSYRQIIDNEDWTATTLEFRIWRAAVLDDVDDFIKLLPGAVASDGISKLAIREWPVFKTIRSDARVKEKFEEIFKEPLIREESIPNPVGAE